MVGEIFKDSEINFLFFFFDAGKLIEIDDRGDTFDGREL